MGFNKVLATTISTATTAVIATVAILALAPNSWAAKYKAGTVANGGAISGKVSFKGDVPKDAVE